MLRMANALPLVLCLASTMSSPGFAQTFYPGVCLTSHVLTPDQFTPANLRPDRSSEKATDAFHHTMKTAYWEGCNRGCSSPCERATDTVPGHIGQRFCVSCHSCSTATLSCRDNFPGGGGC
jgi:hypothetical protein